MGKAEQTFKTVFLLGALSAVFLAVGFALGGQSGMMGTGQASGEEAIVNNMFSGVFHANLPGAELGAAVGRLEGQRVAADRVARRIEGDAVDLHHRR